jgi:hypothetical protein
MKIRANLTIEADLWDKAKIFFSENPEMGSISAFIEMTLREFMEFMPEMVAKARAGDGQAALAVLQRSHNVMNAQNSLGLIEMDKLLRVAGRSLDLKKSEEVVKPKKSKKSV